MKESKFIELLNLYVDHQISPADAALLEAEVRGGDPERRRIYRQYCQMQKACTELAENFRAEAAANPKIVEFNPRRRALFGTVAYATGLAAVAACVALVFVARSRQDQPVTIPVANVQGHVAARAKSPLVQTLASRQVLQPVIGPRLLRLQGQNAVLAAAAAPSVYQTSFADWMNNVRLSSMPVGPSDEFHFDTRATLQPDGHTYRSDRPFQGKVEWTAFQFQK